MTTKCSEDTEEALPTDSEERSIDQPDAEHLSETEEDAQNHIYQLFDSDDEDFQRRCALLEAIVNAETRDEKRKAEQEGCEKYHQHRTISKKQLRRYVKRYLNKEFHTLTPGRKDKGQFRKYKEWYDFIIGYYKWGQQDGSRMNIHQVYTHLNSLALQGEKLKDSKFNKKFKKFPKVREDLIQGDHPTDPTIRKYIKHHLAQKPSKPRHPGSPFEGQILQTIDDTIELIHSGKAWQCDHTQLDVLVVDDNNEFIYKTDKNGKEILGRPYITIVQDAFSGCVMGFHLGLEQAGSHEVALALRHSILPKSYDAKFSNGLDFDINQYWKVYGLPEYFVTDRAKEFKSEHMRHVARQLDFKLRLRSFPQAGGLVETIFDKFNKELLSLLPGYTGSNVQKRPDNAENFACITLDELEMLVVRYLSLHWNNHNYPKNERQIHTQKRIRYDRWKAHLLTEPQKFEERELDVCLLKSSNTRKVEKRGFINAWCLKYHGDCLTEYIGKEIRFRYDQRNVTRVLAYTLSTGTDPEQFIGVLQARDLDRLQISLKELEWMKDKLEKQGKKVNHHAILAIAQERLATAEFVDKKRSERRRTKRRQTQAKRNVDTNQSKVTELFPDDQKKQAKPAQKKENSISPQPNQPKVNSRLKTVKSLKKKGKRHLDKPIIDWERSFQEDW